MPRNAGRETPKDVLLRMAREGTAVERVHAEVPGYGVVTALKLVNARRAFEVLEAWSKGFKYTSTLRNSLQRHFKKITYGEWFMDEVMMVKSSTVQKVESMWEAADVVPHPRWLELDWHRENCGLTCQERAEEVWNLKKSTDTEKQHSLPLLPQGPNPYDPVAIQQALQELASSALNQEQVSLNAQNGLLGLSASQPPNSLPHPPLGPLGAQHLALGSPAQGMQHSALGAQHSHFPMPQLPGSQPFMPQHSIPQHAKSQQAPLQPYGAQGSVLGMQNFQAQTPQPRDLQAPLPPAAHLLSAPALNSQGSNYSASQSLLPPALNPPSHSDSLPQNLQPFGNQPQAPNPQDSAAPGAVATSFCPQAPLGFPASASNFHFNQPAASQPSTSQPSQAQPFLSQHPQHPHSQSASSQPLVAQPPAMLATAPQPSMPQPPLPPSDLLPPQNQMFQVPQPFNSSAPQLLAPSLGQVPQT